MPIHDWTRVEAGIFHHFHQAWITELARALNAGLLPPDYYAMAEQHAGGFGPDVLALQGVRDNPTREDDLGPSDASVGLMIAPPKVKRTIETEQGFYRRKQNNVTVRHVSDDRVIAMVEVVSPGNKSGRVALRKFVDKATSMLERGVHLLILDLLPPGLHDPKGLHAAIWEDNTGDEVEPEAGRPLMLVSYESAETLRAFVEPTVVGDEPSEMPLFLVPGGYVLVPLGPTYRAAYEAFPRRWRGVLEE